MNKTQSTIIDPNFSRDTPDNKGRIPNTLSYMLPGETFRNYFDRVYEEYHTKNSYYFNRLVATNQDTPIKCTNQVEFEAFNQLQSIIEMTEELNATRTSLKTSLTYSYQYAQQTHTHKTNFNKNREAKRSNDLIERFLTSVELNNIQAIERFLARNCQYELFEDNCTQALEISLYNYCSDTQFKAMVTFLMDTIIAKQLTHKIPKTILIAYQDVLETLGYTVNI